MVSDVLFLKHTLPAQYYMKYFHKILLLVLLFSFYSCKQSEKEVSKNISAVSDDPLPSWNEGEVKSAIIEYVTRVTDSSNNEFIPVEDRIATFDNDGNLWSEQPYYYQLAFAMDRIREMAAENPGWSNEQPFKAAIDGDMQTVLSSGTHGLLELVMVSHAGMTAAEFDGIVEDWIDTARHPRFDQPYNNLIYQPMLELLDYLRANEFKTYIVSGGGVEFMRVWAPEAYGIPADQIVGSTIKTVFEYSNDEAVIRRLPEIDFIDDKEGKPIGINKFIGKKPVFASGNSDGDLQMLQYTASNNHLSFLLYLHHTDSEREWAYDRDSHIGRLDKGLDEAKERGWTVIDMKRDWKVIYPFQMD